MIFSIITPCIKADIAKLKTLRQNLIDQNSDQFEWLIALNSPLPPVFSKGLKFNIHRVSFSPQQPGAARNAAIQQATGDYLVFIDADDLILPNTFHKLQAITRQHYPLIDLNEYPTYEPGTVCLANYAQQPDWLPRNTQNRHLLTRPLNLISLLINSQFDHSVFQRGELRNWLTNKFLIYDHPTDESSIGLLLKLPGKVILRKMVIDYHLTFSETNPVYANSQFLMQSAGLTNQYVKLQVPGYLRIKHNDPINDPSLHQKWGAPRWLYKLSDYEDGLKVLPNHSPLKQALGHHILRVLNRRLPHSYQKLTRSQQRRLLIELANLLNQIPGDQLTSHQLKHSIFTKIKRHHFQHVGKSFSRLIYHQQWQKIRQHRGRGFLRLIYHRFLIKLPIRPHVILYESFLGRNYSDSPKAIYQYLLKHYPQKYTHVWVMNQEKINQGPKGPHTKVVKRFGWRYMYYLAVSKYQIFNMRQPSWFIKRAQTIFVETWHGTPLKHLVFDIDNITSANPRYKAIFYHQSRQWDYLITANQFSVDTFHHAFKFPRQKMLHSGYPRNDALVAKNQQSRRITQIKKKLGIPSNKKVILYAPTWRDDQYFGPGKYKFHLILNLKKLQATLGNDYVILVRTHYFIANQLDLSHYSGFAYNVSDYNEIADLYLISDLLITDYSSVFFDYAILGKPILFFIYDYQKYADNLRGFYLDMQKDLPGPLLKTTEEVISTIQDLPAVERRYLLKYVNFSDRFNAWEKGNAAKKVVTKIFKDR
ncbi:bifunctional glycosyltransferase family 2 protein/CDP-glycerol:glycerophosphate glycerophosphotransferase [Lentilactobacillus hilgardii]|nr:bifunctional glycosyltransferase family 2 protein/CDP-glycerol:glycerophosphate glycerophosphotransferase [Lentilactobacillus hilgardii]MCV3741243.1 bifunctional glycosyltransferase family 2 protein/CDP-glycerol:glycerophosphate glycerophosphotransferase [Lentilactobacillus hilgardii]